METRAWVAYSCSAGVAQELDEAALRPRLPQPAQGHGRHSADLGVLVRERCRAGGRRGPRGAARPAPRGRGSPRPRWPAARSPPPRGWRRCAGRARDRRGGGRGAGRASRPARRPSASRAGPRKNASSRRSRSAGAARGSPISPRAWMAGYWSQGSSRSASMRGGTASGEPIWPRLGRGGVAHVHVGVLAGRRSGPPPRAGSRSEPSITAENWRTSSSGRAGGPAAAPPRPAPRRT